MSGSSFFVAFRVLSHERRRAIETVYAFCRSADDAVDDAVDPAAARAALGAVTARLDGAFAGRFEDDATRELGAVVRAFSLPRAPFDFLLEGVGWDLEGRSYETRADLREYCRRVASSVGLLCVRIFGCPGTRCDAYAEELGVALQWTNVLRDLGSDLARDRVYVPRASLRAHGLEADELRAPGAGRDEAISALVRSEAAYARSRFAEAARLLPPEERRRVLAGSIMGAVYETLLGKIDRAGAGVLERRVRISGSRRAWIALRMFLREHASEPRETAR